MSTASKGRDKAIAGATNVLAGGLGSMATTGAATAFLGFGSMATGGVALVGIGVVGYFLGKKVLKAAKKAIADTPDEDEEPKANAD